MPRMASPPREERPYSLPHGTVHGVRNGRGHLVAFAGTGRLGWNAAQHRAARLNRTRAARDVRIARNLDVAR